MKIEDVFIEDVNKSRKILRIFEEVTGKK